MVLKSYVNMHFGMLLLNSFSQTTNYAINNDGTGFVQTSTIINELNGLAKLPCKYGLNQ